MNQSRSVSFLQFQLPALAWAIFIFTVSSIPAERIPSLVNYTDKLIHGGVYFLLCWLLHVAFHFQENEFLQSKSLWIAFIVASVYGVSDEYHQLFTRGRTTEFYDWAADTTGALAYVVLYSRLKFYRSVSGNSEKQ